MVKVSIIIPMYNAEQTIVNCLNSIKSQSYKNFEVIIVDDGSTDNSYACCLETINEDNRFKIIRQPNYGVSKARNNGLDHSIGEFVSFVDSDDWLEPDALEVMVNNSDNVDMVFSNFYYDYGEAYKKVGTVSRNGIKKNEIKSFPLGLLVPEASLYYDHIIVSAMGAACGKLTRRALITENNISFNEKLQLGEDGLFHLQCFLASNDVIILSKPTYHYVQINSSANHRYRPDVHENCNSEFYRCFIQEAKKVEKRYQEEFKVLISYRCYLSLISLYIFHPSNKVSLRRKYLLLKHHLRSSKIYDITGAIPKSIHFAKRVEIYLLKHKACMLLILYYTLRKKIKSI